MKKFISIIIVTFLLFVGCSMVPAKPTVNTPNIPGDIVEAPMYAYDGEFDPVVLFSWDVVRKAVCTGGHVHYFLQNPDKDAKIKRAETINIPAGDGKYKLIGYRYFKYGVEYIFYLNTSKGHYTQVRPEKGVGI